MPHHLTAAFGTFLNNVCKELTDLGLSLTNVESALRFHGNDKITAQADRLSLVQSRIMAISRDILVSALFPDTCEEKPPVKDMVEEGVLFKNGPLSKGSDITTFTFHDHDVRVMIEDQPWFFAADVSKVLGYRRVDYAVRILDEDEKSIRLIQTDGGAQKYSVITEPGLYRLLMRSDRPEAKPFQKWVVSEVLPALRKSGAYSAPTTTALLTKDTP